MRLFSSSMKNSKIHSSRHLPQILKYMLSHSGDFVPFLGGILRPYHFWRYKWLLRSKNFWGFGLQQILRRIGRVLSTHLITTHPSHIKRLQLLNRSKQLLNRSLYFIEILYSFGQIFCWPNFMIWKLKSCENDCRNRKIQCAESDFWIFV